MAQWRSGYNNNAGGFLVGADYRLSENFAAGLFAGYEYSYAKYNDGSSTQGNSALFGLYGSYTHEAGYYADAVVSGGYTGFQTRRAIEFFDNGVDADVFHLRGVKLIEYRIAAQALQRPFARRD